jgi:hypothetical protein
MRRNLGMQRDQNYAHTEEKPHKDIARRSHPHTKERGLRKNQLCQLIDLGLIASSTVRNKISVV